MNIKHPLKWNELYPIQSVLMDLACQEGCDGEPYDQMVEAREYINELEGKLKNVLKIIEERSIFDTPEDIYNAIEWEWELWKLF